MGIDQFPCVVVLRLRQGRAHAALLHGLAIVQNPNIDSGSISEGQVT